MTTTFATAASELRPSVRPEGHATPAAERVMPRRAGELPAPRGLSTWQVLSPASLQADPVLAAVERELDRPGTTAELRACEAEERYPEPLLERLYALGLLTLFADPVDEPAADASVSAWRVNALCALAARRSGSLAVAIAHNGLAMLPLYIAGTPEQLREASSRLRRGELAALLLTEREHGSDLLSTETRAERGVLDADGTFRPIAEESAASGYRLRGRKHLINGGARAAQLVTLARTRERPAERATAFESPADLSLFLVPRDASVSSPGKERTLPVAAAEIAGVVFADTIVPASALIGEEGEGFSIIQRALAISRCAIASFAAGAANAAADLAFAHARSRVLYGAPITRLDCVAEHLARLAALDLIATALSIKATALVNAYGQGAAHHTAVAKLACCALAEQAVEEGRRALGAAALVVASPYERLVRDAPLYGVFDGTSHVMLEHLQRKLARAAAATSEVNSGLEALRMAYTEPPRSLVERLRERVRAPSWPVAAHAVALADLPGIPLDHLPALADALLELTRALRRSGRWGADQTLRFALADCYARLEALLALVELGDRDRRAALGLPPRDGDAAVYLDLVYRFALHWLGAEIAGTLRRLALRTGEPAGAPLDGLEGVLLRACESSRQALLQHISQTNGAPDEC
jgi:alkylation response protein AidB-like acyl-CoA dehydrogenase